MKVLDRRKGRDMTQEEIYKDISSASNDGFKYVNYLTNQVIISDKFKTFFNVGDGEVVTDEWLKQNIFPEDKNSYSDKMDRAIRNRQTSFEFEYRTVDGKRWISNTGTMRYDEDGNMIEKVSFYKDITELKQKQLGLEYMAYFDSETGLYNRNYFVKRLERAISKIPKSCNRVQVIYLDIENYNVIKDVFGFVLSDEVIIKFAKMLSQYTSHVVKVGRFNNNEFAIALFDAKSDDEALELYKDIVKKVEKPISISDGSDVYVSLNAGIAAYPTGGRTAVDLIRCADIAMYNVKQHGKNGMFVFEENMLKKFVKNVQLEQELKLAVENFDFKLNYQPQFYSEGRRLRGVEALIRWQLPNGQYVSPAEFIPMAEKNGSIVNIGAWVIKRALRDFAELQEKYAYNGIMSINISAIQLRDKSFKDILLHYVEENQLKPDNIEIEITESVLIEDFESTINILNELRLMGFKISLDDFGTGYSSLSYLKDIPINTLKIDKSFVDTILIDASTSIITDAVITMVKKLGLETIAEGVETEEQYEYLRKMNCDNIQGFLLGKPMPKEELIELIMNENRNRLESCNYG